MPNFNLNTSRAVRKIAQIVVSLVVLNFIYAFSVAYENDDPPGSSPHSVKIANDNLNMPSAGVIASQYSDSPNGTQIDKIVDNKVKTKFVTPHAQFHILWVGDENEPINYYSLSSANDAPEKDPKSWSLSGANEGEEEWTLLDKQDDQTFTRRGETKEYQFENKIPYKYYMLNIESNAGDTSTQIAEWSMQMIWTDIDNLLKDTSGDTHSNLTPMGRFFENRHVTTEEDRIWLNNAKEDAPLPDGDLRSHTYSRVKLYPSGNPVFSDANQRTIDNCSVIAALAAMAYSQPEFIKSIIKDNGDKTYTISIFDPQGKPLKVSVNSNFLSKNGKTLGVIGKNKEANWSSVLEKALMKYNHIYKISDTYDLGRRVGAEHALPIFTGNGDSYGFAPYTISPKNLARAINAWLDQGKFVVGGFNTSNIAVDGSTIVRGHVYSVMRSSDKKYLFLMRNPWGNNPNGGGSKDGVLRIPNNIQVAPSINVRMIEPGIAAKKDGN